MPESLNGILGRRRRRIPFLQENFSETFKNEERKKRRTLHSIAKKGESEGGAANHFGKTPPPLHLCNFPECVFFLRRIRLDCLLLRCLSQCCRKRGQNVELERRNLRWSDNGINNQK